MTRGSSSPLFVHKKIIFATDFLESSRLALDYAVGFAHRYQSTIVMIHAFQLTQAALEAEMISGKPSCQRRSAVERLDGFAAGVRRAGIKVEIRLEEGDPCDVLLRAADPSKADLIVLGTHGIHRGMNHLVLGSNTERILLSSCIPTLTVGRHVLGGIDLDLRFRELLYISDFSPEAAAAAPFALTLAQDFDTWVDICQLTPSSAEQDPTLRHSSVAEYTETLKRILPDGEHRWSSTAFQLDRRMMKDQILERARSDRAGLIVLGVKRQSALDRRLHTSFAYQLISEATCPVLTVHRP